MSCLNCDCDECQMSRLKEDERVADIVELHTSPRWVKAYGKCNCFYCGN